jgi:hypothetical protein
VTLQLGDREKRHVADIGRAPPETADWSERQCRKADALGIAHRARCEHMRPPKGESVR